MESMVSAAPSAWLKMENSLHGVSQWSRLLEIASGVLVLPILGRLLSSAPDAWITLLYVLLAGLAAAVALALASLRGFCEGAMERLRQLGQLV